MPGIKNPKIYIYESPILLTRALCESFIKMIHKADRQKKTLNIALSGGNTPQLFFEQLSEYGSKVSWDNVHFYWGDERCVPPDHPESNFGMVNKTLFSRINIPHQNVHRIQGEKDPISEAGRYRDHLRECISAKEGSLPVFDWILLGLGEDGHTASIFPGDSTVIRSTEICVVASQPLSGQKRITLTLPVINNAKRITLLVSGKNKADITAKILNSKKDAITLPAAMVQSHKKAIEWYLDKNAAALL